jgi:hypothetical protein
MKDQQTNMFSEPTEPDFSWNSETKPNHSSFVSYQETALESPNTAIPQVEMDIDPNLPELDLNNEDVDMSLAPEPAWKSDIQKTMDEIKRKLNSDEYVINIREQRKSKAVKLKKEPFNILDTHKDLKSITKDKELNWQIKHLKPNTNLDVNDKVKIISLLEDLGKFFNVFVCLENLDESEKQKMVYAMHLLTDLDEVSSKNYLEQNKWNFQEVTLYFIENS